MDASAPPRLDLRVTVPVPDMENPPLPSQEPRGGAILSELYAREVARPPQERGLWAAIYPALLCSVSLLIGVSLMTPRPDPEKWRPFFKAGA